MRKLAMLVGLLAGVLASTAPAAAQYPGTTSTTSAVPPPAVASQSVGALDIGQSTTIASCALQPGQVSVGVNGRGGATDTVDADGCARTPLGVLSSSQVRVAGVVFSATCGTDSNTVSVSGTGTGTAGAARIVNTVFGVDCPAAAGGLLPRTGALVVRWSLLGGALMAVGALLVLADRRRPAPGNA